MNIKTFVYDVRGYSAGLGARIDSDYATWHASATPTSVDGINSTISNDVLIVTVRWTT